MLLRRRRQPRRGWRATNEGAPFDPRDSGKVRRWYRLQASTPVSGEYETVEEVFGGSDITQTDADRKPAAGTSSNSLPIATFDGTDLWLMPLDASGTGNNGVTKFGFWFRFRPASVSGLQRLFRITAVTDGASANKLDIYANNATLIAEAYITNVTGRALTTGNVLTASTWGSIYLQYDSSRGGDDNLRIFTGGSNAGGTYSSIGAGGTLGALQSTTGNAILGAGTSSDTPVQPIQNGGLWGPNAFACDDNLTASELAALELFEAPT